jgi:hypothetical protein
MAFNSAERLMGGKRTRRKGPRAKRAKKSKRKAVTVKVKIKGSPKQVQHAMQDLSGGGDNVGSALNG